MSDFAVHVIRDGRRERIAFDGEIDLSSSAKLAELGLAALADDLVDKVEIDLSGASFIDSTGLGQLITVHETAQKLDKSLVLYNPSFAVRRLLHLTATDTLFTVVGASTVNERSRPA